MHSRVRKSFAAALVAALLVGMSGQAYAAPPPAKAIAQAVVVHARGNAPPPPAAFRSAWQRGNVDELPDTVKGPTQLASALRFKADQMSWAIGKATGPDANPHANRYIKENLRRDLSTLVDALGNLQERGKLDPTTEARAMATASRVLAAAAQAGITLSDDPKNRTEALVSGALYRQRVNNHDTAIEVEAGMTSGILAALTTRDGTVGPVLEDGGRKAPDFLQKIAGQRPIASVGWNELKPDEQLNLLRSQSARHEFSSNRSIPGVIYRPNASKALLAKVEHLGPESVESVNGVELHVRQPGTASHNAQDSLVVAESMGAYPLSRHQHIPNKIPASVLKGDAVDRLRLVDFYRRANITADLLGVLEGYPLKPNKRDGVTYFDYMHSADLFVMNEHLYSVATRGRGTIGPDTMKMGSVGFRTGELYKDTQMFGFELRALTPGSNGEEKMRFSNAVQKGVLTGSYGTPRATMEEWHKQVVGTGGSHAQIAERQGKVLISLHFNRRIRGLLEEAPADIKASITPKVRKGLLDKADDQYSLKLLVHDWSKDPVISSKPGLATRVVAAQKVALAELDKNGFEGSDMNMRTIATFVRESGLYDTYSESLGMREKSVAP